MKTKMRYTEIYTKYSVIKKHLKTFLIYLSMDMKRKTLLTLVAEAIVFNYHYNKYSSAEK